ncbi:MAG: hypothetical protein ACR2LX_07960 [Jatrophihabitans sp.]
MRCPVGLALVHGQLLLVHRELTLQPRDSCGFASLSRQGSPIGCLLRPDQLMRFVGETLLGEVGSPHLNDPGVL